MTDIAITLASGTSWHAALVGEYLIEELAQIPVEVEFAHEFCYRNCPLEKNTILLVLSQSGETADTLAALREARRRGHRALAIVNVVGSTIARESDGGIYDARGPGNRQRGLHEGVRFHPHRTDVVGGASGTAAAVVGAARAGNFTRTGSFSQSRLNQYPEQNTALKKLAKKYGHGGRFLFSGTRLSRFRLRSGRRAGSLQGDFTHPRRRLFGAAEMKHGPIALIDAEDAGRCSWCRRTRCTRRRLPISP